MKCLSTIIDDVLVICAKLLLIFLLHFTSHCCRYVNITNHSRLSYK